MAAENLQQRGSCTHYRGTCFLFNADPYEYSRSDLDSICTDVHSKGISNDSTVWEMYSSSSGLSCFIVLLPYKASRKMNKSSRSSQSESAASLSGSYQWPYQSLGYTGKDCCEGSGKDTRLSSGMWSADSYTSVPDNSEFHSDDRRTLTGNNGNRTVEYMLHQVDRSKGQQLQHGGHKTMAAANQFDYQTNKNSELHSALSYESLCPPATLDCHYHSMRHHRLKERSRTEIQQHPAAIPSPSYNAESLVHSMFTYPLSKPASSSPRKWNIITLGLKLDKVDGKVCPCYKVYSVNPGQWLPAGMVQGKHKGRTSSITIREVIGEYLRELEKFGKYKKIGRNCSDFAAMFINLMSTDSGSGSQRKKVSGMEVMCEACHRWICKCCCC